jgi:cell division protein FtsX
MLEKLRDSGASKAASMWLESKIGEYAEVENVTINSREKQIDLLLHPRGDDKNLKIRVEAYSVENRDEKYILSVQEVSSSREWLTRLAKDYIVGREYIIPEIAAIIL